MILEAENTFLGTCLETIGETIPKRVFLFIYIYTVNHKERRPKT